MDPAQPGEDAGDVRGRPHAAGPAPRRAKAPPPPPAVPTHARRDAARRSRGLRHGPLPVRCRGTNCGRRPSFTEVTAACRYLHGCVCGCFDARARAPSYGCEAASRPPRSDSGGRAEACRRGSGASPCRADPAYAAGRRERRPNRGKCGDRNDKVRSRVKERHGQFLRGRQS